jgi:hypothetical protein
MIAVATVDVTSHASRGPAPCTTMTLISGLVRGDRDRVLDLVGRQRGGTIVFEDLGAVERDGGPQTVRRAQDRLVPRLPRRNLRHS